MIITKTINADLWLHDRPQEIHAVQGDTATRKILIKLYANREPWIPAKGVSIAIRYRKPDGTGGTYDTMPDGTKAWELTENSISFLLAPQMLTVPGRVEVQTELHSGGSVLASFLFYVLVEENVASGAPQSQNYFNWAQRLELKLQETLAEAKESGLFDGPVGATPNLQIGTVTTLAAGSNAEASIGGTAEAPILNLGLPKGADASLDTTLAVSGKAADAAAVGTALAKKAPAQLHITKQLTAQGWYKIGTMTAGNGSFHCGAATLYIPGHYSSSVPPVSIVDVVIAYNSAKAKVRIAAGTLTNQITKVGLIAETNSKYGVYVYYNGGKNNAAIYVDKIGGYFTTEQFTASDVAESNMISVAYVNEYDDPPMKLGVEYRTTERYNEKPVYTALVSCGNLPATGQTKTDVGSLCHIISSHVTYGDTQGSMEDINYSWYTKDYDTVVIVKGANATDHSALTAKALVKYWKG